MRRRVIPVLLLAAFVALSIAAAQQQHTKQPVVPKEKIVLFNGKDLTGWKLFVPEDSGVEPDDVWSVKDGLIRCEGKPFGYMRTETPYANYILHLEWRWPENPVNSGVFLHTQLPDKVWPKTIECQLMADHAGHFVLINGTGLKGRPADPEEPVLSLPMLKPSSENPPPQWNTYDIVCKDDCIVAIVNGVIQAVGTGASVTSGYIALQSEGAPIEFRNIHLEPVEKSD